MKRVCRLPGQAYSQNKNKIKGAIKSQGMKWKGTLKNPKWESDKEKVSAIFIKDEEGVTQEATLIYESEQPTGFENEFVEMCMLNGGELITESELKETTTKKKDIETELRLSNLREEIKWYDLNKQRQLEDMKYGRYRAPAGFIRREKERMKKERKMLYKELYDIGEVEEPEWLK